MRLMVRLAILLAFAAGAGASAEGASILSALKVQRPPLISPMIPGGSTF